MGEEDAIMAKRKEGARIANFMVGGVEIEC